MFLCVNFQQIVKKLTSKCAVLHIHRYRDICRFNQSQILTETSKTIWYLLYTKCTENFYHLWNCFHIEHVEGFLLVIHDTMQCDNYLHGIYIVLSIINPRWSEVHKKMSQVHTLCHLIKQNKTNLVNWSIYRRFWGWHLA